MAIRDWNPPRVDNPRPHLSAGKYLTPQRYVVGWPSGLIKIGCTDFGRRRWGPFLARGGTMLDLAKYERLIHGLEAEVWLQKRVGQRFPQAFRDKADAIPYMGPSGAGYLECYAVPVESWPEIIELARLM